MEDFIINKRIKELRERLGLSVKDFSAKIGEKEQRMRDIEAGRQRVPGTVLALIVEHFHVSGDWLLVGSSAGPVVSGEEFSETYALVPLYAAEASMGNGHVNHEGEAIRAMVAFERSLLREEGLNPKHLAAIRARGHSMEPLIRDGALLVFDTERTRPGDEGVYVVRIGDELLAKRLIPLPGGAVEVHSQAPGWPPRRVEAADLPALGIVGRVEIVSQRVK